MQWLISLILFCTVWTAGARIAVVAHSGRVEQGYVRLTGGRLVLADAAKNLSLRIDPSNVVWAFFEEPGPVSFQPRIAPTTEGWLEADIGQVSIRGDVRREGDTITLRSAGVGVRSMADSFHFIYKAATTNSEIVARVAMVHNTDPLAQAGVMMRDQLGVDARCVMLGLTPERAGFLLWRELEVGHAQLQPQPDMSAPYWVKLKREGDDFFAYKSPNGRQWLLAGKTTVRMGTNYFAGLAAASGRDYTLNWTTFDKVGDGVYVENAEFPPRAELISGSVVAGWPVTLREDALEFHWNFSEVTVPLRVVSRLLFQWASPDWLSTTRAQGSGVWLANGEFFEGDFRSVSAGRLLVSSVLYGNRAFDANSEVTMVGFQRERLRPAKYEIRTVSGSVWRAQSLVFGENEVTLKEPAMGTVHIPLHELSAIFQR